MANLIFKYTGEAEELNREAKEINLTIGDDLTIMEYKTVVRRMASALGYTEKTINKAFGDEI